MELSTRKKAFAPRSRSGCLECRQHHRKCDERRPACALCQKYSRTCQYGIRIKWGGRPFGKSTFGKCMLGARSQPMQVVQLQSAAVGTKDTDSRSGSPFVYGVTQTKTDSSWSPTQQQASASGLEITLSESQVQQLQPTISLVTDELEIRAPLATTAPSFLPDLPRPYRSLLDYFTRVAESFSCNEAVKRDLCATFMPMATQKSHVMASMLSLAAIHRANAGLAQSSRQLALLQTVAVEQLRVQVSESSGYPTEDIMATIMMLCYSDIVAGGDKANSWRLHLQGAASLFSRDIASWTKTSSSLTRRFIVRCFVSLVALANVSGRPPTEDVSKQALQMLDGSSHRVIDEFTAYSSDLVHIFVRIGGLLRSKHETLNATDFECATRSDDESARLIYQLREMVDREQKGLDPSTPCALSSNRGDEYMKINEAYHYAALLHIYQRIRRLPSAADEIQEAVHRILTLLSGVQFLHGPCPGIVLLFPLFSAGCGAIRPHDRQKVRSSLQGMVKMFGIKTVQQSLKVLETIWSHRDANGESESSLAWETFVDGNVDLILY